MTDLRIRAIRFANPPQLPQIAEIFKNGERLFVVYEVGVIDITAVPTCVEMAELRTEGEV